MIKNFVNLTNGIEAINDLEDFSFIRIQSTTLERNNWYKLFAELDHNLLMWLALGCECRIYDFGANRPISKTIYLGLPIIEYCLNKYWLQYEQDKVWAGRAFSINIKKQVEEIYQRLFVYHDEKNINVKIALDTKFRYYRRYIPEGLTRLRLMGISNITSHDSDIGFYKNVLTIRRRKEMEMIDCRYIDKTLRCAHLRREILCLKENRCLLTFRAAKAFCKLQIEIPRDISLIDFSVLESDGDYVTGSYEAFLRESDGTGIEQPEPLIS